MKGLHVLVVDDSALMRGLLCEAIRASGVPIGDVLDARDGGEALEILKDRHVDVVVTDLQMPKVDGFALVERITLRPSLAHIRIVTMTAEMSPRTVSSRGGHEGPRAPQQADSLRYDPGPAGANLAARGRRAQKEGLETLTPQKKLPIVNSKSVWCS